MCQQFGVGREKKIFLSTLAHQRRKKQSIKRLKYAIPTEKAFVTADTVPFMQAITSQGRYSLTGYVGQGYVDPFHTRSVPMNDSMNMYFHHCTSSLIAVQKAILTTAVSLYANSASYHPS
jgi:hypothetical protein